MDKINYEMGILIVDDSASMRRVIKKFLLNNKFSRLFEAGNGKEALDIIQAQSVDLIISDLNMPAMDGLALLEQVKKNPDTADIPFIILTVEAIQKTMNTAISMNVDSYIVKPVEENVFIDELIRVIRSKDQDTEYLL